VKAVRVVDQSRFASHLPSCSQEQRQGRLAYDRDPLLGHFGPEAPIGFEANSIQTVPG
jgi:hypothetical protein